MLHVNLLTLKTSSNSGMLHTPSTFRWHEWPTTEVLKGIQVCSEQYRQCHWMECPAENKINYQSNDFWQIRNQRDGVYCLLWAYERDRNIRQTLSLTEEMHDFYKLCASSVLDHTMLNRNHQILFQISLFHGSRDRSGILHEKKEK